MSKILKYIWWYCLLIIAVACTKDDTKMERRTNYGALEVTVSEMIGSQPWSNSSRGASCDTLDLMAQVPASSVDLGSDWTLTAHIVDLAAPTQNQTSEQRAQTRGTPVTKANNLPSLGLAIYKEESANFSATTPIWRRMSATNEGRAGNWSIKGDAVVWPVETTKLSFFACSPYPTSTAGLNWTADGRTLEYSVPTAVDNQPDLCYAAPPILNRQNISGSGNHVVLLTMKHALTALSFNASAHKVKIISATVKNVKTQGTLNLESGAWSRISTTGNRAAGVNERVDSPTIIDITKADGHLMMLPQTLDDAAILELIFDDLSVSPTQRIVKTVRLNTLVSPWVAGKQIFYNIQLKTQFYLTLDPTTIRLSSPAGNYNAINYASDSPKTPTLTSNQGWISNLKAENGKITFSYTENTSSTATRTAIITVNVGLTKQTVTVYQNPKTPPNPPANCHLIKPNAAAIAINVSGANADGVERIGDNDIISAEMIWQDTQGKMGTASSCIKSISTVGIGKYGQLIVQAGSIEGNAVIAVKVNGVVRWSWHIWVTNYTMTAGAMGVMNRILGSKSNNSGDLNSLGLYYQWGRKDPFIGPSSWSGASSDKAIYDASGGRIYVTITLVAVTDNFENAIKNPLIFYYSGSGVRDWVTNGGASTQRGTLWASKKTPYDPCPDGWIVPESSVWQALDRNSVLKPISRGRYNAAWGFYPYGGQRASYNGRFKVVGQDGLVWSRTDGGNPGGWPNSNKFLHYFSRDLYSSQYQDYRASGMNIRCIKQ